MIREIREKYNRNFSDKVYQSMLDSIEKTYEYRPTFHICETPIFIPESLKNHLITACEQVLAFIDQPNFKTISEGAFFQEEMRVPGEDDRSLFIAMDFGITYHESAGLVPQLIECQGFPTLNLFQYMLAGKYREFFDIPDGFSTHPDGMSRKAYKEAVYRAIVSEHAPEEVVLLDVEPEKQNTRIDFIVTCRELGIKELCVTKVIKKGKSLFYKNELGLEVPIKRIYNRVIFDELHQRKDLIFPAIFSEEIDAEWAGHPNWFFRISKYLLPLLQSEYVPPCYFLSDLTDYPDDLENYVLKPLYSFAGAGVRMNFTSRELDGIQNRKNYLLQKKVPYEPIIPTLDVNAKCEVRMIAMYDEAQKKYRLINNLVRLSKGEMIGVKYNKDKTWVGGSIGFFEG